MGGWYHHNKPLSCIWLSQIDFNDNKQYHPDLWSIFTEMTKPDFTEIYNCYIAKVSLENSFKKGYKVSARFIYIYMYISYFCSDSEIIFLYNTFEVTLYSFIWYICSYSIFVCLSYSLSFTFIKVVFLFCTKRQLHIVFFTFSQKCCGSLTFSFSNLKNRFDYRADYCSCRAFKITFNFINEICSC